MMRSKLIILTDLWGNINSNWIKIYAEKLKDKFEVKLYSSCEIAEIDSFKKTEKEIHNEFIKSGIEKAVENLLKLEKEEINILAFSVGGIIAWKSEIQGLKIRNLKAISSTRLRYEINKPKCNLNLYFGENDEYKPKKEWFENINLNYEIVKNAEHKVYENLDFATKVCENINRNW
jgi:hypothetical protein